MRKMSRAIVCLTMAMLLVVCMSTAALAEHCKYGSEGGCEVIWWVDTDARMHCRACKTHVEDKDDINSHVMITEWSSCTPDAGGECTICGWDYIKDSAPDELDEEIEAYMLEIFMMTAYDLKTSPVEFKVSGNTIEIKFSEAYLTELAAWGIEPTETMSISTFYTLGLRNGSSYAYTGSEIKPAELSRSEYGPMDWLLKHAENNLIKVGDIMYQNNINPGTATASVTFTVLDTFSQTLSVNFTITGDADGGNDDGGDVDDDKKEELINEALKTEDGVVIIEGALIQTGEAPRLKSEPVALNDVDHKALLSKLNQIGENETAVSLSEVQLADAEIQEGGAVTVRIRVGNEYDGWQMRVLHGLKNGSVEEFSTVAQNGEVKVTVSELSPFAVIAVNPSAGNDGGAVDSMPDLPKTGDASLPMSFLLLALFVSVGSICLLARRKYN